MYRKRGESQILRVLTPIIIYQMITGFVACIIISIKLSKMLPVFMRDANMDNPEANVEIFTKLLGGIVQYSALIVIISAIIAIPIFIWMFKRDIKRQEEFGMRKREKNGRPWMYIGIVVLGIAVCIGLNNLIALSGLTTFDKSYEVTAKALYNVPLWQQILGMVILAPIMEELLYRGLFYNRIVEARTKHSAMIISALVFGWLHGNWTQGLYAIILGILLVYVYEKHGSLLAAILLHMVVNCTSVIISNLGILEWLFKSPIAVGIVTVACSAISATMLVSMHRIDNPVFN